MKKIILFISLLLVTSCTTIKEIPVEVPTVKTEYVNVHTVDTIYKDKVVHIKEKGDTVYINEKEYLYKYKSVTDTIFKTDTITKVKYVEVEVEVNKLKDWQIILMVLGGILLGFCGFKLLRIFIK